MLNNFKTKTVIDITINANLYILTVSQKENVKIILFLVWSYGKFC